MRITVYSGTTTSPLPVVFECHQPLAASGPSPGLLLSLSFIPNPTSPLATIFHPLGKISSELLHRVLIVSGKRKLIKGERIDVTTLHYYYYYHHHYSSLRQHHIFRKGHIGVYRKGNGIYLALRGFLGTIYRDDFVYLTWR